MVDSARIIEALGLERHPEGGWFRETYRAAAGEDERAAVTAIQFLLEAGERSHWHRVDADEIWCWHAGAALTLKLADGDAGAVERVRLGGDVLAGETGQAVVPKGWWQAAEAGEGWALVSCVVAPGFEFSGFVLAVEGWEPGGAGAKG